MEPKSIRAKTTLIYKTQLVDDALEAKQAGGEVAELDAYLLPPALWEHYQAERKPRPPADEHDDEGGDAQRGGPATARRGGAGETAGRDDGSKSPAAAPLDVSWTDFVDVNTANGYQISKRTAPPPPASASAKKKQKKRNGSAPGAPAASAAAANADDDSGGEAAGAVDDAAEVFEVERILKKRVRKGKAAEYLVQWVGYPDAADTTWEAEENLANAKALVNAFEKDEAQSRAEKIKKSPGTSRRSNRQTAGGSNAAFAAAAAAATAAVLDDGSESDEYNLSQSQSQSEPESTGSRSQAQRGIDHRSSRRLKTLQHELSGDVATAGKVVAGAASARDPGVAAKRWSSTQDSKLLAVVAGKRRVSAALWTEASAETGRSVEDCKARRSYLQDKEGGK